MGLYTLNLERERENWDTISCIKHSIIHYSHHVLTDSVVSNSLWPHGLLKAPLSMGFSRQEYWCGLPSPSPGDLPNPGIEPRAPALQVDSLPAELPGKPRIFCTPPVGGFEPRSTTWQAGIPTTIQTSHHATHYIPRTFFIIRSLYLSINFTHFAPTPMPVSGNFQSINCIYGGLFLTYLKNILKLTGDEYTYLQIFCVLNHPVMFDSLWSHGL